MKCLIKCMMLIVFTVTIGLAADRTTLKNKANITHNSTPPGLHFIPPPPPPPPPPNTPPPPPPSN